MRRLDFLDLVGNDANRFVIRHVGKAAGRGGIAPDRVKQPVRMRALKISLHAFGAEHSAVKWKFLPWLKADHFVALDLQLDAALLSAKTAVRFNKFVGFDAGIQPDAGTECRMRTEAVVDLHFIRGSNRHHILL